jgi:Putative adipose-regulatory protein (Seipin)
MIMDRTQHLLFAFLLTIVDFLDDLVGFYNRSNRNNVIALFSSIFRVLFLIFQVVLVFGVSFVVSIVSYNVMESYVVILNDVSLPVYLITRQVDNSLLLNKNVFPQPSVVDVTSRFFSKPDVKPLHETYFVQETNISLSSLTQYTTLSTPKVNSNQDSMNQRYFSPNQRFQLDLQLTIPDTFQNQQWPTSGVFMALYSTEAKGRDTLIADCIRTISVTSPSYLYQFLRDWFLFPVQFVGLISLNRDETVTITCFQNYQDSIEHPVTKIQIVVLNSYLQISKSSLHIVPEKNWYMRYVYDSKYWIFVKPILLGLFTSIVFSFSCFLAVMFRYFIWKQIGFGIPSDFGVLKKDGFGIVKLDPVNDSSLAASSGPQVKPFRKALQTVLEERKSAGQSSSSFVGPVTIEVPSSPVENNLRVDTAVAVADTSIDSITEEDWLEYDGADSKQLGMYQEVLDGLRQRKLGLSD